MSFNHQVSIGFRRTGSLQITEDVIDYEIVNDMLDLADRFAVTLPTSTELWQLVREDNEVEIWIDDSQVFSGFVESRIKQGDRITVTGRDRGGRLVTESAPLLTYGGTDLKALALKIAGEWFDNVVITNAENRDLIAGRGRRRKTGPEPIFSRRNVRHKVMPGESRSDVLLDVLEQAELMAWSSADGKTLFVGLPNQNQPPSWHFFQAGQNSARSQETNVLNLTYGIDVAERYAQITVCGAGRGDSRNYGRAVTQRIGNAFSEDVFARGKTLLIADSDIRSTAEAKARAEREMAELEAGGVRLEIEVSGHGQSDPRKPAPAIYGFDTVAHVEDEEIELKADFFVTRAVFRGSKPTSSTMLSMVPKGTTLRSSG